MPIASVTELRQWLGFDQLTASLQLNDIEGKVESISLDLLSTAGLMRSRDFIGFMDRVTVLWQKSVDVEDQIGGYNLGFQRRINKIQQDLLHIAETAVEFY
ncbi:hypothetical protein COB21_05890 [Candidatus Aerophobetes bacterium]|uniref:Uncharacterized protein n=1 Tax=Aerophobetes bacterium TaxID=2030807 RepID=A0A2A4WZH2_UNCAE|nr:MAG: hypothetical protein COB21_05890 [Candidatus Aerophobetes bacterium]